MTNATNSPAVNDTMEDKTKVIPITSAILRPVPAYDITAIVLQYHFMSYREDSIRWGRGRGDFIYLCPRRTLFTGE